MRENYKWKRIERKKIEDYKMYRERKEEKVKGENKLRKIKEE